MVYTAYLIAEEKNASFDETIKFQRTMQVLKSTHQCMEFIFKNLRTDLKYVAEFDFSSIQDYTIEIRPN